MDTCVGESIFQMTNRCLLHRSSFWLQWLEVAERSSSLPVGIAFSLFAFSGEQWREGDGWKKWVETKAPAVNARRRVFAMLRNKEAVEILFDLIAERFEDRPGGYTRILRLAKPRLGDNGTQAILELVGERDRVVRKSEKPAFDVGTDEVANEEPAAEETEEEVTSDATAEAGDSAEATADDAAATEETKEGE